MQGTPASVKPDGGSLWVDKNLDSGHLKYPTPELIGICQLTCNFINKVMKSAEVRRSGKLCTLLLSALLPHFTRCPALMCEANDPEHSKKLSEMLLRKLLRPLLCNWAGSVNATVERLLKLVQKPLSRKVLRL
ncbi:hypothetical protein HPB49_009903 [Dermacentor silvarum]|uniref:Uncharacterized protein n=1 Tax=Dermacentor silvarum TaxID=543639 RepID=A0ACB8D4I1_DERSI|nr:hypothetical protein HPB49_009903 [Dermacentor silvarum]